MAAAEAFDLTMKSDGIPDEEQRHKNLLNALFGDHIAGWSPEVLGENLDLHRVHQLFIKHVEEKIQDLEAFQELTCRSIAKSIDDVDAKFQRKFDDLIRENLPQMVKKLSKRVVKMEERLAMLLDSLSSE
jgi:hypothetical protein